MEPFVSTRLPLAQPPNPCAQRRTRIDTRQLLNDHFPTTDECENPPTALLAALLSDSPNVIISIQSHSKQNDIK
jgi:hypothetical protein